MEKDGRHKGRKERYVCLVEIASSRKLTATSYRQGRALDVVLCDQCVLSQVLYRLFVVHTSTKAIRLKPRCIVNFDALFILQVHILF